MNCIVLIYFMLPRSALGILKTSEKMYFQPEGFDELGRQYNKCKDLEVA